jgi:glutamine amidotransferase-like uncharacterized protein
MKGSFINLRGTTLLMVVLVISLTLISLLPQENLQDSEKKYTEILGDYEFDLSDKGIGILIIKFYVEDGALWARTETSYEPGELKPTEGKKYEFILDDPDEGLYELKFLKDEYGRYTKCYVKNSNLGIDTVGRKLEIKTTYFPTLRQRLMSRKNLTKIKDDLSGIRVAIYFGHGMDGHSALAIGRAFQWMGCHVEIVHAESIKSDCLNHYDVLAFPGGESNPNPWEELGLDGKSKIQRFIRDGGGYIGICLGALFASDKCDFWGTKLGADELYLDIFPGVAYCGQVEIAPKGSWPLMTDLKISNHTHPITDSLPDRIKVVYYPNGPYLQPYKDTHITVVATFEITGNPAMVAFEYGKGKVFLSGPHPEIEVDSDRDGSNKFNKLSDEGSEWPLLLAVMKWLTAR